MRCRLPYDFSPRSSTDYHPKPFAAYPDLQAWPLRLRCWECKASHRITVPNIMLYTIESSASNLISTSTCGEHSSSCLHLPDELKTFHHVACDAKPVFGTNRRPSLAALSHLLRYPCKSCFPQLYVCRFPVQFVWLLLSHFSFSLFFWMISNCCISLVGSSHSPSLWSLNVFLVPVARDCVQEVSGGRRSRNPRRP